MLTKLSKEFKVKQKITYQHYLKTYIIKYVTETKINLEFAMYNVHHHEIQTLNCVA